MRDTSTYNDRPFRWALALVGAYVMSEFGGEDGYFSLERLRSKEFLIEYGSSAFIALVLVEIVAWATRLLDRHFDWQKHTIQRTFLQLLMGVGIPVLADLLLATLYFRIFRINILDTSYFQYALPFIIALIVLLNTYYVILFFFLRARSLNRSRENDGDFGKPFFMSTKGIARHSIPTKNIACFYRHIDQTFLRTFEEDEYILSQSLDTVEKSLSPGHFFRATRQLIINLKTVKSFKPTESGKLLLSLKPSAPHDIATTISREKATIFKKRMQQLEEGYRG